MSKTTTISSQSNPALVTVTPNVVNVSSQVFRLTVPRGASYDLMNRTRVKGQDVKGLLLILDLNTAAGIRINGASIVKLRTLNPAQEDPKTIRALPYGIWRDISSTQQRNDDFKATLASATDLDTPALRLGEFRQVIIEVVSSDLIDWTRSYIQFDVEEFN